MDLGASGLTCGTVGEARSFVAAGFNDVLLANVIASPSKWHAIALLQTTGEVIACVDSPAHVMEASKAAREVGVRIPVYIELDIGLRRSGVADSRSFEELLTLILDTDSLHVVGVMGYEGHCLGVWPRAAKEKACVEAINRLLEASELMRQRGVESCIVSCGGTGTYDIVSRLDGVTEIQAGGGCLMDVLYEDVFHVSGLETALLVDTTVVSRAEGTAIVDAGLKAVAGHSNVMPRVNGLAGVDVVRLSAEHGTLKVVEEEEGVEVGRRISLVPGRIDTTVFLHDVMFVVDDGYVAEVLPLVRHHW